MFTHIRDRLSFFCSLLILVFRFDSAEGMLQSVTNHLRTDQLLGTLVDLSSLSLLLSVLSHIVWFMSYYHSLFGSGSLLLS